MSGNVEKHDNIIEYERKIKKMGKEKSSKKQKTEDIQDEKHKNIGNILNILGIIGGALTVIGAVYTVILFTVVPNIKQEKDIESIQRDLREQSGEIQNVKNNLDRIDDSLTEMSENIIIINTLLNSKIGNEKAVPVSFKGEYNPRLVMSDNEKFLSEPKMKEEDEKIASGLKDSNVQYTNEDLQNRLIITMYSEGESEVYFLGRYNENNHWSGKCILNVYKENELVTIFEGIYDDGNLYSYKRASCDGESGWIITVRKPQKDRNGNEYKSGETWNYTKTHSFGQAINKREIEEDKILTVDEFLNETEEQLTGYYSGNTSGGLYNDETGRAYIARYNDDGNLRYLYRGKVEEGKGKSDDGWAIILANDNTYRIYKGKFANSSPENIENYEEVTKEIIQEIYDFGYNCPLTGLVE